MSMSMSNASRVFVALLVTMAALETAGCAPPPSIPAVPPGVDIRETLMPKEEPAEAQGEVGGGQSKPTTLQGLVPAPPTAKGEVKTTTSGVKYETVKEGSGEPAKAGQRVTVHYVGKLDDGRTFDSSRDRDKPETFTIGTGAVITGWDEAVPGMLPGEVRKLTIPPNAGYGALGSGKSVPPNATLHFEIELLKAE